MPSFIAYLFTCLFILSGCTYSVSVVHSEGQASDVIDNDQKSDPTVSPTITVPIKPL